jgi:hypothetical protein
LHRVIQKLSGNVRYAGNDNYLRRNYVKVLQRFVSVEDDGRSTDREKYLSLCTFG